LLNKNEQISQLLKFLLVAIDIAPILSDDRKFRAEE
jgi:hypothetical protein